MIKSLGVGGSAPSQRHNFAASAPPSATDDASQGYSVGSRWLWPLTRSEWRCVDATAGAAVWIQADVLDHGGYVAGNWYLPVQTPQSTGGANPGTAGLITLLPGVVKERVLVNALGVRVSTAGTGNVAAAVYRGRAGRGGALVGNTAAMSTASVASINAPLAQGDVVLEPGIYWFATMMDNTAAALLAAIATAANPILGALLGSTSQTIAMTAQGMGGYTTPGTFGMWPADLSGATLTELTSARAGVVAFRTGALS